MFDIPTWPVCSPSGHLDYGSEVDEKMERKINLEEIESRSASFPVEFPIDTGCCKVLKNNVSVEILERNINSAYPVLSEDVLPLYINFISHKRQFGNEEERKMYESMSLVQLVDRFLLKRAVVFVGVHDYYILLDGRKGAGIKDLTLDECLSYDEIKLSAFLSVSSYSYFINDGNRHNAGVLNRNNIEEEGVVIGLIGARLVKLNVMEFQDIVVTKEQNQESNGYGAQFAPTLQTIFSGFYEKPCYTFEQVFDAVSENPSHFDQGTKLVFDKSTYCKRLTLSFDTLLHEANSRAKEKGTTAFIHVVGIGLGVWKLAAYQDTLFLDTFAKRIEILGSSLYSVSDIVFAYFGNNEYCGNFKDGEVIPIPGHPKDGIRVYFSQRQPHTKLTHEHEGKLLVVSYAWDGNALPGNEYWAGHLCGSGDSAQASSSQIAEIHNPHINRQVCGANLRIATRNGVVPFSDYRMRAANSAS